MVTHASTKHEESGSFSARKADFVDQHVGHKVKACRKKLAMSQQVLAEQLGISYQQLQKYECGSNRISAGRLYTLSQIMDVPISHFYTGLPDIKLRQAN